MCRFKSGIILKNKIIVAPGESDSHTDLLESIGIEDNYINEEKMFVRAELIQENDKWWINPEEHPEMWRFIVDQDITPDWFDKEKYEKMFRESVCIWWKEHVLIEKKIDELKSGYYRLKRCEVKKLCNDVKILLDSSQVSKMYDSSRVSKMYDSSRVNEMYDSSQVSKMYDSSRVSKMYDSSRVNEMYDSSQVNEMHGCSRVSKMYDSSRVNEMYDSSRVSKMYGGPQVNEMCDNSQVNEMHGCSRVGKMYDNSRVNEMHGSSQVSKMYDSSRVNEMYDSSSAKDFKNYPSIKILISEDGKFEIVRMKSN